MSRRTPILALDIGLRRTGVALSESGILARPLTTLSWQPPHAATLIGEICKLVEKYEVATILAGVPYAGPEGGQTDQLQKTEHILKQLEETLAERTPSVTLVRTNEYLSTQDGKTAYPEADRDSAAAAILLQNYLELI